MPFVIKSVGGERVLTKTGTKNSVSTTQDDLIEALRGLTFRFEVKIVGVDRTPPTSGQLEAEAAPPSPKEPTIKVEPPIREPMVAAVQPSVVPPAKVAPRFIPSSVKIPLASSSAATTTTTTAAATATQNGAMAASSPVTQAPATAATTTTVPTGKLGGDSLDMFKENVKPSSNKVPISERIEAMMKIKKKVDEEITTSSPKTKLIKGELSIGDTIDTCYLTSDDSKDPPVIFITYSNDKLLHITETMSRLTPKIESYPEPAANSINVGDFVVAKSKEDDTWYRAMVTDTKGVSHKVYFFDWGLNEDLDILRIKKFTHPELEVTKNPACALKVCFVNQPEEPLGECEFTMQVESYDQYQDIYSARLISIK